MLSQHAFPPLFSTFESTEKGSPLFPSPFLAFEKGSSNTPEPILNHLQPHQKHPHPHQQQQQQKGEVTKNSFSSFSSSSSSLLPKALKFADETVSAQNMREREEKERERGSESENRAREQVHTLNNMLAKERDKVQELELKLRFQREQFARTLAVGEENIRNATMLCLVAVENDKKSNERQLKYKEQTDARIGEMIAALKDLDKQHKARLVDLEIEQKETEKLRKELSRERERANELESRLYGSKNRRLERESRARVNLYNRVHRDRDRDRDRGTDIDRDRHRDRDRDRDGEETTSTTTTATQPPFDTILPSPNSHTHTCYPAKSDCLCHCLNLSHNTGTLTTLSDAKNSTRSSSCSACFPLSEIGVPRIMNTNNKTMNRESSLNRTRSNKYPSQCVSCGDNERYTYRERPREKERERGSKQRDRESSIADRGRVSEDGEGEPGGEKPGAGGGCAYMCKCA